MDVKQLRIGNWVAFNSNNPKDLVDKYCTVDETVFIDYSQGYDLYDPIPLTPEILEKAGFELKVNGRQILNINSLFEFGESHEHPNSVILYCHCRCASSHIQYLHQLQNLYFILCGKELQIEL